MFPKHTVAESELFERFGSTQTIAFYFINIDLGAAEVEKQEFASR